MKKSLYAGRPLHEVPVATTHADLAGNAIRELPGTASGGCSKANSPACLHGTFMAGILLAKRGSPAPAICPSCALLASPIFGDAPDKKEMPSATPEDLAAAILTCVEAGARILNLSLALTQSVAKGGERPLAERQEQAGKRAYTSGHADAIVRTCLAAVERSFD
jgi:subtilisin family serine protease